MNKNYLLVVTGPTASGKTAWCIRLAQHFDTEIISADARQFYREMNAGTAKPSATQRALVKHHFIDSLPVTAPYNAGRFEQDCLTLLGQLFAKSRLVILCGGSGLYIDAVLYGLDALPPADAVLRKELASKSTDELRKQLYVLDPVHYARADLRNPQRMIRAIEVTLLTGIPYSSQRRNQPAVRDFEGIVTGIETDREDLYKAIEKRVDDMMANGLAAEARQLLAHRNAEALRTIGYSELFRYFDGEITLEEAVKQIKRNTRHYARRQLTWWRKHKHIAWFKPHEYNKLLQFVEQKIN